jgi:hypothetical protein
MSVPLTKEQLEDLARQFTEVATIIKEYQMANCASMSPEQHRRIALLICDLSDVSNYLITKAVGLIIENAQNSLIEIKNATTQAKKAIGHLRDIQHTISLITAVVGLGTAVMTGNLMMIIPAITNVIAQSQSQTAADGA